MKFDIRKDIYKAIIAALVVLCCFLYYRGEMIRSELVDAALTQNVDNRLSDAQTSDSDTVSFYIFGDVKNWGMYQISKGGNVKDAIIMAGGELKFDKTKMDKSLRQEVENGDRICVVHVQGAVNKRELLSENMKVNINTADKDELYNIPSIGEVTADSILEYRDKVGGFVSVDEIRNVKGIDGKTFEAIKDYITVE